MISNMEDTANRIKSFLEYSWSRSELLCKHDPAAVSELQGEVQDMNESEIGLLKDVVSQLFQTV